MDGNARVDSETVRSFFTGTSPEEVEKGLEALRKSGRFSNGVREPQEAAHVVIRVTEGNQINRVAFEGNSKVKTEKLPARSAHARRMAPSIRRLRKPTSRACWKSIAAPAAPRRRSPIAPSSCRMARIDVVFTVDEGDKTGVKEIRFVGNNVYSTRRLVGMMETTEMNFLSFIKTSDVYDPDRIASDLELVRRFYLKNGYADFRVVSSDAQFDPAAGRLHHHHRRGGGPAVSRRQSVDIELHLPDVDRAELQHYAAPVARRHLQWRRGREDGRIADPRNRQEGLRLHAGASARRAQSRRRRRSRSASCVDEGPRVYIERINIRGNTRTRDYVIRREFEIGEGDAYNRVLVDRAERRLNGLGYLQEGASHQRAGLVARSRDRQRRCRGSADRQLRRLGRLFDDGGLHRRSLGVGKQLHGPRPGVAPVGAGRPDRARGVTFSFTEPYFLDQRISAGFDLFAQSAGRLQLLRSTARPRSAARCASASRSPTRSASRRAIRSIRRRSRSRTEQQPSVQRLYSADPRLTPGVSGRSYRRRQYPNIIYNCQTNGEASLAIKESQGTILTSLVGYSLNYNTHRQLP